MTRLFLARIGLVVLGSPVAYACSGPGAHRVIAENIAYSRWSALGVGLMLLPIGYRYVRGGLWEAALPHGVLLALHPAWTISAMHGDCGYLQAGASTVVLVLTCVAWAVSPLVVRWQRARERAVDVRVCRKCGYDLRATPERCPECGTEVAPGVTDKDVGKTDERRRSP